MILNGLSDFAIWIVDMIFAGFQAISLPANLISVVLDIMKFGAWVVGADLLAIIFGNVFMWLGFKFIAGLILFVYRLIPLT